MIKSTTLIDMYSGFYPRKLSYCDKLRKLKPTTYRRNCGRLCQILLIFLILSRLYIISIMAINKKARTIAIRAFFVNVNYFFFGLPPFFPFSLEDCAFFSLVFFPISPAMYAGSISLPQCGHFISTPLLVKNCI